MQQWDVVGVLLVLCVAVNGIRAAGALIGGNPMACLSMQMK